MNYDVAVYGAMIADWGRTDAFVRAIESRVTPGAVVADIGTGSGLFAMVACRAGASRVYAIESADIIQVAREAAAANGFGERIRFIQQVAPGLSFSNAPWCDRHVYRQVFFPWPDAVACSTGNEIRVLLRADLVNGEYVFSWQTDIVDGRSGTSVRSFCQSTFNGAPWSRETLHRRANLHQPAPNDWAAVDRRVLELMDGCRSIDELADEILGAFPRLIRSRGEALTRVGDLSARYARRPAS